MLWNMTTKMYYTILQKIRKVNNVKYKYVEYKILENIFLQSKTYCFDSKFMYK